MSSKRTLLSTSPDHKEHTPKKYAPSLNMSVSSQQDVFTWSKLCEVLDDKLKGVAKKEDLTDIKHEIEELKHENSKLKEDIKKLTNRLELVDQKSRTTNIMVPPAKSKGF
ncbi:uncharacterized protein LOC131997633 [Stomoxys calcitrans]|uniref:uncharacterized protein LOC131994975 n=1 Tax=Stomoxys calcitrans TaxID=35570 RepID=UPI0027E39D88|nr:uncharacterized protein LOC131994975 [Stomoxys calcitrans]XP_059224768.1 uncharacterized protein LOC131997633 [Stomoxys calcitrans]